MLSVRQAPLIGLEPKRGPNVYPQLVQTLLDTALARMGDDVASAKMLDDGRFPLIS
jgi:hypothetical protein